MNCINPRRANRRLAKSLLIPFSLRRGYTPGVTPVPIPNTAVKTRRADDTAPHRSGKVGRCDVKSLSGHPFNLDGPIFMSHPPQWRGIITYSSGYTGCSAWRISMGKGVYTFGGNRNEGSAAMRDLLGGKGCNLAEMAGLGIPVPPGFTLTTEQCGAYYTNGRQLAEALKAEVLEALRWLEGVRGCTLRRRPEPPAALRPLRRPGVHARHDGHRAEPRTQRRHRRGPGRRQRQPALRLGLLPALHHHVQQRGAGRRARPLRGGAGTRQGTPRQAPGHGAERGGMEGSCRRLQGDRAGGDRKGLPAGSDGAAVGCHPRRLRELEHAPRHHVPPSAPVLRRLGHGRERAEHGLRQHGRRLRHGCGLHARSRHRARSSSTAST